MKRFTRLFLIFALLTALCSVSALASNTQPLRVGLHYGSGALAAPQLQNAVGSGYQTGFYDSSKVFHSLLPLSQTKLAILKDTNYTLSGDTTYQESTNGEIGAYHIQLPESYVSATEASLAAAKQVNGFVAYVNGTYYVRTGSYPTLSSASLASGNGTPVGSSPNGLTVVETGTSKILFEYEGSDPFAIAPQGTDPLTWCKGFQYRGNFTYTRKDGGNISVINYVSPDDYVKGVIPYEMSAEWPLEALKAQAVCARSYALGSLDKHASNGFDVCNTTDCQVYQGANRASENSDLAVDQTSGEYTAYQGKVVTAFFFSSDGGATEDAGNVWGTDLPYLKGVLDPYEDTENINKGVWETTLSAAQVSEKLNNAGFSIGTVTSLAVTKTSAVGNVLEVTATDANGKTVVVSKGKCRTVFGLNSQRYTITGNGSGQGLAVPSITQTAYAAAARNDLGSHIKEGILSILQNTKPTQTPNIQPQTPLPSAQISTAFTFSGRGWGHHVGMSQYGAKAMAEKGMTYEQILQFYYTNIEILK